MASNFKPVLLISFELISFFFFLNKIKVAGSKAALHKLDVQSLTLLLLSTTCLVFANSVDPDQ